jgi:hypothetical protein
MDRTDTKQRKGSRIYPNINNGKQLSGERGGTMTLEIVRSALAWCTLINWLLLLWWLIFFILGRDWMYRFHSRWFKLSDETFDTFHYAGMGLFKTAIIVFNLVPYLALRIVG